MKKTIGNTTRPAVLILAAGLSKRMARPKHQLPFSLDETFLEHIIKVYLKFWVSQLILVVNSPDDFHGYTDEENIKIVVNDHPEYGRFHSIQLGLKEIQKVPVFIQNVDNPFVTPGLLMALEVGIEDDDYAVPVYNGKGGHPILLSQKIIRKVAGVFKKEDKLSGVLMNFVRKDVPMQDPYILVNINTEEDYLNYFSGF
ncbi:MAG: NTP transferase domain-containing protein [Bacteroidales bacterium]|nr:NTP transferase domain-containing protein [Bacteroidales bacterium]MCF8404712.1 NTP transferase domain-containing protein [Bacteroidales bacterium]